MSSSYRTPPPPRVSSLAFQVSNLLLLALLAQKVACYVSLSFLQKFAVSLFFPQETDDFMALDVFTPQGCFGTNFHRFRLGNPYARSFSP